MTKKECADKLEDDTKTLLKGVKNSPKVGQLSSFDRIKQPIYRLLLEFCESEWNKVILFRRKKHIWPIFSSKVHRKWPNSTNFDGKKWFKGM